MTRDTGAAADWTRLARSQRPDPACLLGRSFGAEVVAATAAAASDRVRAVVLAAPTSDPAARSRTAQILRWLRDVPREPLWQVPLFARDASQGAQRVGGGEAGRP
ncbi:serine aminopeptidase domain-containing protein [Asanoa siamensis]|uniref:serine aminopeptidase domain-containing protein n=1 Tax=Asanoa siamensis TaxID=926357 RepID=UPI0019451A3A|nr:hypothetical protein [Asanoa siamensis]